MSEEINFDDIEFGEPIEERKPTYRDGYIRGIYRAKNIIDSKQKEIERLNSIINNDFSKICREKMIDKLSANEMILLQDKEIERLNNIIFNQNKRNSHQRIANDNLQNKNKELNNIINELEKWVVESIEKYTEDYLDWKYDRNVYLAGSKKLQNVFDKLQELKGSDKE